MKARILLLTTIFFLISFIQAQIIQVPGDYNTIQEGINAATDGDTVLVAENTYFENIRFMGKAITVGSEYILDGDSSHIVNTIIDGSQATDPDSAATVMFINGEDTTSIINGFTITGGAGVYNTTYQLIWGGGIYSWNSGCSIRNNIIINNQIESDNIAGGAGICCSMNSGDYWANIQDNYIGNNTSISHGYSAYAGGINMANINGRIMNNLIEYNLCTNTSEIVDGGGIELEASTNPTVYIIENIIQHNTLEGVTEAYGAGIIANGVAPVISNNIISNNSMTAQTLAVGGGILVKNSPGPVEITNNIIENNMLEATEGAYGGGIRIVNVSGVTNISDNIISANTLDGGINAWGGGIGAYNADNISITNNTIEDNSCTSASQQAGGGGINVLRCGKTYITNNEINENAIYAGNYAWGGGILLDKAKTIVYLNHNSINGNTSEGIGMGGGISIYNETDTVSYFINSNKILNNYSDSRGGGLLARNTYRMYMTNNLFKSNVCDYAGGAVMYYMTAKRSERDDNYYPVIANNTFITNTAAMGGAIFNGYYYKVAIIFNSIFWDNSANNGKDLYNSSTLNMQVYNNEIDTTMISTPWTGADNIFCNPIFQSDSIHLDWPSMCVNAGIESFTFENNTYYCPDQDIDGNDRPFDWTLPDIGADEAQWHYVSKFEHAANKDMELTVYPNPFSHTLNIQFDLSERMHTNLFVRNAQGQKVETIASGSLNIGAYQFEWHANDLPSGIYQLVLRSEDQESIIKIIKIK